MGFKLVLLELVEDTVVFNDNLPKSYQSIGLTGLLMDSFQGPFNPVSISAWRLVVPVWNEYVE